VTRSSGRRNGREGIKVVFNGSCENREEIGKKWRALDLETEVEAIQRSRQQHSIHKIHGTSNTNLFTS
jgi:hypothetical protein